MALIKKSKSTGFSEVTVVVHTSLLNRLYKDFQDIQHDEPNLDELLELEIRKLLLIKGR
jgi:hypothetical protein